MPPIVSVPVVFPWSFSKAERERLGLSLAEISERSGMAREVIYRLESQTTPNPTIGTIQRYATALGLEVSFGLKRITNSIQQAT